MFTNELWKKQPKDGFEFIYRYFDKDGRSYIGHTKRSLCARAGGKNGINYTRFPSKFQEAIDDLGFDSFQYEILEEVQTEFVERKEKYYIAKYNSTQDGYNSTYGGKAYYYNIGKSKSINKGELTKKSLKISLQNFSQVEIGNLTHNLLLFFNTEDNSMSIDSILEKAKNTYFSFQCFLNASRADYVAVTCHPLSAFFNRYDRFSASKYGSKQEIIDTIQNHNWIGDDIFTVGDEEVLEIVLTNNTIISLPLFYEIDYHL